MTGLGGLTTIAPTSTTNRPVSLNEILSPIWNWLRYIGLQHGFLSPIEEHRIFYNIRCISTMLILFLVLNDFVFKLTQLLIEIPHSKSIADISINVVMFTASFMSVMFYQQFYTKQKQLVRFFKDWNELEMLFNRCCNRNRTKWITKVVSVICSILLFSSVLFMSLWNLIAPNESIFFSHFHVLQDIFGLYFLAVVFSISFHYLMVSMLFGQFIPAFFFYQAGCMIENLKGELKNCFITVHNQHLVHLRNENPVRLIWEKYESIYHLVNRANHLFGVTMITNQFCLVCLTCTHIYLIINLYEYSPTFYVYPIRVIFFVALTVWFNWLVSYLYLSCGELKTAIASLLSEKWQIIIQDHRDLLIFFYNRVDKEDLAACPLNLYRIDPTSLMSILTLHVSYVIVLLQAS